MAGQISVRKALSFAPGAVGSVAQRIAKAGVTKPPHSLRAVMNAVSPETRTFVKEIGAGDVSTHSELTIASNGEYVWRVSSFDDGTFFGDKYTLTVALNRKTLDRQTLVLSRKEALDANEHGGWTEAGTCAWLKDNWATASQSTDLYAHITVSWDVTFEDIMSILSGGLLVAAIIVMGSGKCQWGYDEYVRAVCRVDLDK
jgi:hypothetical protein